MTTVSFFFTQPHYAGTLLVKRKNKQRFYPRTKLLTGSKRADKHQQQVAAQTSDFTRSLLQFLLVLFLNSNDFFLTMEHL